MHPFTFKPLLIIPYGWVKLHCVYLSQFLDPFHQLGTWVVSKAWILWILL
jgi:hypothetical protein